MATDKCSQSRQHEQGFSRFWLTEYVTHLSPDTTDTINRGLSRLYSNQQAEGVSDLSKAGELGLYSAYSIIKKYRK